jgi:hypothetical protein
MNGKINSNIISRYSYTDYWVQPNVVYYYRLRQKDTDNNEKLSDTRQAIIKGKGKLLATINPNPASEAITVFVSGANGKATMSLFDATGRRVKNWKNQNPSLGRGCRLNIQGIAAGVYTLSIYTGKQTITEKVVVK